MGEGRRTAKTQLGPLCSFLGFSLPTQPPPPPPAHLAGVVRGAYTGAVKAYLTFSICKVLENGISFFLPFFTFILFFLMRAFFFFKV